MNKKIIVALDLDNIKKAIKLVKELKKEVYANSPDYERTIYTPEMEDMHTLADGGTVDLDTALEVIEKGMDIDRTPRPESPGGTGDPVLYEDED